MSRLNEPITIKSIELTNRIVMPPMATSKSKNGRVTKELIEYYDEKSKGGSVGLIITEHKYISNDGKADFGQISIAEDEDIAGLKQIAEVIHKNGSKVIAQINHAGSFAPQAVTGCEPIGASAVPNIGYRQKEGVVPREMNQTEINRIVRDFARATRRAKEAGFDGVELHSAHGYLLNQFYSPLFNKRKDEYGGSIEGRIKIHLEVIKEVRKAVGEGFLLALRLGASDYKEGGSRIEDAVFASKKFEEAGVDLLDISGGFNGFTRSDKKEPGYFSDASLAIKKEAAIPVILTGGVRKAEEGEKLLREGKADLIGVGRSMLKNSNWAKEALAQLEML